MYLNLTYKSMILTNFLFNQRDQLNNNHYFSDELFGVINSEYSEPPVKKILFWVFGKKGGIPVC